MEWILYLCGISSGAFLTLGSFVLVFFYKTRGFRLNLEILNGVVREKGEEREDYFAAAHPDRLPAPRAGDERVPALREEPPTRD